MGNIILIGYRGVGKTTLAKELSKKLKIPIISTDAEISRIVGNINYFVQKKGWKKFRDIEKKIIQNLKSDNSIIDCGGGIVEDKKNIQKLQKMGTIIWLKANPETIIKRLEKSYQRPSLLDRNNPTYEIKKKMFDRAKLYKNASDFSIDTENKTAIELANLIIDKMIVSAT